jgi:hypothetical protein
MTATLAQACTPRPSVFNPSVRDAVYSIDDLPSINPAEFFEENFVTQGMRQLLTEAFARLEGTNPNAPGAFLLSQSMGGGKTHNLLALGLLAKHPEFRAAVMGGAENEPSIRRIQVVAFNGRNTSTQFGIWGEIATQLNRRSIFEQFYTPLYPPGADDWVELLKGDPVLIMLDELPPYFQAARAKEVGATTLDVITTTALANLLSAVASGKLPNACVVLTDLSGSAYAIGSDQLSSALRDLDQEANRTVQRIDPVRLNSDEFYSILRTRLFEKLPDQATVDRVADAFRDALDAAQKTDLTTASPQHLRAEIVKAYPFHPGIRDLYARFRENQGFQQTRALIRLMRLVTAALWNSGAASQRHLIGAHELDFHDNDVISEIRQINRTLDNAIAHDIADDNHGSVAESIDGPHGHDAQDAARLIFMSSLSTAVNPVLGLTRSEIVQNLAAPNRDLGGLTRHLDELQQSAWYIHATATGSLLFKNVENLNAKLEAYATGATSDKKEVELRARLAEMFKPKLADCYQAIDALPALDQVQLTADRVTLIVMRPDATMQAEMRRFFEAQQWKNRVLFLTGRENEYQQVLKALGYLYAIDAIIKEFRAQGMRENDPQLLDALGIKDNQEASFYFACRETFQTIWYPSKNGLTEKELDPKYVSNKYEGEKQIDEALYEAYKFRPDAGADTSFRSSVENKLWPQGVAEASWSDIKRRSASDPSWNWHHPKALDDLKQALVTKDQWRDLGNGFIAKGPFPPPPATVSVQVLSRDPNTGKVKLRITPRNADKVAISESGPATEYSTPLDAWEIETDKVSLSFLGLDTAREHQQGEPITWQNTIEVKHRFFQDGDQWRCELKAIPSGEIRYTTDGSSPTSNGQVYDAPFVIPPDSRYLQAYAKQDGVVSEMVRLDAPKGKALGVIVDPNKGATWRRGFKKDDTSATFDLLDQLKKHRAWPGGIRLTGQRDGQWWELTTDEQSFKEPERIGELATQMMELFPGRNITLDVDVLQFASGQDLLDLVAALKTSLKEGEVKQ